MKTKNHRIAGVVVGLALGAILAAPAHAVTTTTRGDPAGAADGSAVLRTALITLTGIGLAALLGVVLAIRQRRLDGTA